MCTPSHINDTHTLSQHSLDDCVAALFPSHAPPPLSTPTPRPSPEAHYQLIGLAWYLVAKVTEHFDKQIFQLTGKRISGHTIKHLAAALTPVSLAMMLAARKQL